MDPSDLNGFCVLVLRCDYGMVGLLTALLLDACPPSTRAAASVLIAE